MTTLDVESSLTYEVEEPTSFAFSIAAARTPHQTVLYESIELEPATSHEYVPYGTGSHQLIRLDAACGRLTANYRATVTLDADVSDPATLTEVAFGDVPADVLPYLNPSRYCESDRLGDFAWRHFSDATPGHERVRAVSDWVNQNLVYQPARTDAASTAADVLLQRAGVCRDFAHVGIALCRALGIPARYVSGYGVGVEPQDFHGFFEAYLGDDWYLFDPTEMAATTGLVRIGYGRDAADAPFATLVGRATLLEMHVDVRARDSVEESPGATSSA